MAESQNIEIYVENSTAEESGDDIQHGIEEMVGNKDIEEASVSHDLMVNDEAELEQNEIEDWRPFNFSGNKFSGNELRTPISEALRSQKQKKCCRNTNCKGSKGPKYKDKKNDPLKTKLGQWASNKTELVEMPKRHLEEEYRKKMDHIDTKNALELKFMRLEHGVRISALLNH
ncbi:hypothetical protein JTB14_023767 [Gonioctena quinquepunctata]|nr:hypothetical protein JTB14_023767 [Gonioctena quinquepunctata]